MKYRDKILEPLTVEKNISDRNRIKTKSFGYTILGFGSGGAAAPPPFVAAEGGSIATSGDFKIHTFTGPGGVLDNFPSPATGGQPVTAQGYSITVGGGGASAGGGSPMGVLKAAGGNGSGSSAFGVPTTGGGGGGADRMAQASPAVLEEDKVVEELLLLGQEFLDKEMMADLEMMPAVEAEELKLLVELDRQIMLVELEELEELFLLIK